jgi:PAS domain S-box-containing protein
MVVDNKVVTAGARILAVDDIEAKRYAWEKVLTKAGFAVSTASTGLEALELARNEPDLIILDVHLPDIDGLEVCRRIKEEPSTASIPVLHISASLISPEDRATALDGGADGYLTEPVDPEVLIASVRALLRMRRAEEFARKAASEWRSTFDAIQDGVLVVDAGGKISRCNRAFAALSGKPFQAILGREPRDFFAQDLKFDGGGLVEDLGRGQTRQTAEIPWGTGWIRLTVDPIIKDGVYQGATCILSDITERNAAKEQLRALNVDLERRVGERTERLQAVVRELEAFTYTIAHDLRAPLRSMHRFSEVLIEEYGPRLDATGQDYARCIIAGAEKMDTLIGNLLEYSRLAQSEIKLRRLRPSDLVAAVSKALWNEVSAEPPELVVEGSLPEVVGDPMLLSQVLLNLLSNAVKFVRPGVTPRVRVTGERREGKVVLSVVDNGIGIPPESRANLFKVFERLGPAKEYPGTGIGLAIVRRAMERMDGECGVESEAGQGSRFWISLPAPAGGEVP